MSIIDLICLTNNHTSPIFTRKGDNRRWARRHKQEKAMSIHRTILAAALALASVGAAHANELQPVEGRSIDLGKISGVAYYTVERAGFRIVATLAQGETGTPVRFEAVLAPGQSVVLSTPREAGVAASAVEISRQNDRVLVHEGVVVN
jgi:predicted aconitase